MKPNLILRIPAGISDGGEVRVKGRGEPGETDQGDHYVFVSVVPRPVISRKGENIQVTVPVTFTEAVLGADSAVPTLEGNEVKTRIVPGTPNGKRFRVKGRSVKKGVDAGDLMVLTEVQVPQLVDGTAQKALEDFAETNKSEEVRSEFLQRSRA